MTLREEVVGAIRDPILLFFEREFGMIATVESDELTALLADAAIPVVLAAVTERVVALRRYNSAEAAAERAALKKVLVVVARLGEEA